MSRETDPLRNPNAAANSRPSGPASEEERRHSLGMDALESEARLP
jgi:hypothetical protein